MAHEPLGSARGRCRQALTQRLSTRYFPAVGMG
jgi:hypothetical protein